MSQQPRSGAKRILVTAAGGSPATGFIRSLRAAPEPFYIVGTDVDEYHLQRSQADASYLIPRTRDPMFLAVIGDIVSAERVDFLHVQVSEEVLSLSALRGELAALGVRTFLPRHESIELCENKMASNDVWRQAGLTVPGSMMIHDVRDLEEAFARFGPKLWLREIRGSAGKGSIPTDNPETARTWIDFREGWGRFQAAEYLSDRTITWQSIWNDGELVVAQGRKRLYWEFANRAPSGVTGVTGTGVTVSDPLLDEIAQKAVLAIDSRPHGVFGVDLTYDRHGVPNPTEINSARFFTTHQFFTAAGLNMPYILVKLAYGEQPPPIQRRINPLPDGLVWVRGMDVLPVLTTEEKVAQCTRELQERMARLRREA